jgi:hypothetical protein
MDGKNMHYDKSDEEIKSEFQKKLEEKMKERGIPPLPPKSKAHKAIIGTIAFMITAPWVTLVFVGALAYAAFAWGVVLNLFWKWFLLPVFPTLPTITLGQAIGLMMVVSLFDKNMPQVLPVELEDTDRKNILDLISPWIVLLVGIIVKFFLMPLF